MGEHVKPSACDSCPFNEHTQNFHNCTGDPNSPLAVITEHLTFSPLEEAELDTLCTIAGYPTAYIIPLVHCDFPDPTRIPYGAFGECASRYSTAEWKASPANITILAGVMALQHIAGKKQIGKWRGSILNVEGRKVLPTYGTPQLLSWKAARKFRQVARADFRKAGTETGSPELPNLGENFTPNPTMEQVIGFLGRVLKHKPPIGYDIETTGLSIHDNDVKCIGVGAYWNPEIEVVCIPIFNRDGSHYWEEKQLREIVELLTNVFDNPSIPKIAQNSVFDESVLRGRGFEFSGPRWDTCYLHHVNFVELPHNLGFISSVYTKGAFWKDDIKGDEGGDTGEGEEV